MAKPFFLNYGAPLARAFGPHGAPLKRYGYDNVAKKQ